jgi:hypothetical protein
MHSMTVIHMKTFLGSDNCCNAYVFAKLGDDTALVEIGIDRAVDWLDGREEDEVLLGAIIHGGTALRIGG